MKIRLKQHYPKAIFATALLSTGITSFAETTQKTATDNSLATMLIVVACSLLLAIMLLGYVLINAAQFYYERLKEKKQKETIASKTIAVIALCLFFSPVLKAQEVTEQAVQKTSSVINGMTASSFYALISIIALEVIVILVMAYFIKLFIAREKAVAVTEQPASVKQSAFKIWWQKLNSMKPQSEEKEIILAHDYDGIQELDNRLPRWWVWGFYISIIFAGVYLYRYHVAHSAPLSKEEYEIAMVQAEQQKEAYLKKSASLVDENTVTLLTDAAAIQEGGKMYAGNCAPCHGDKGQGIVGPNLTDSYWLHGGSIHDVFKTIKYGYPEKGMKSWKDDFAPVQIAKIASYIKSLHGTNPPNAKEPQGDLYKEEDASVKIDSVSTNDKKLSEIITNKEEIAF